MRFAETRPPTFTAPAPVATERVDRLSVEAHADRAALGLAAGSAVAARIRELLGAQERVRMVFAAAPSQNELLAVLAAAPALEWSRVTAFHMDEYVGLRASDHRAFGHYLVTHLFEQAAPGAVHLIDGTASPEEECERYASLLLSNAIDIVCLGIGENGHLAFNDPPHVDFDDATPMKMVALAPASRRQQVHDGCFASLADVPTHALTLTVPALLAAREAYCCVPGASKRAAVERTLRGTIDPACPASILRRHECARLYLDLDSYPGEAGR
ncbi:MAG: 6-phosphogluconolactonase [Deltaproteobacteria bacterium]|nr:6-phosphogluconolactonase [Deltaproteobacteria bacterium]